jgi:hypothetical protein
MDKNFRIKHKKVLAVEGKDECNFFDALLKYMEFNNIQTINVGGKDKFKSEFELFYGLEGFDQITHLGFVRDAETNSAQSAFESIGGILKVYHLPCPDKRNSITNDHKLCVGIFIMPDNQGTGMLENLCLESIKKTPVEACLDAFVACFKKIQINAEKLKFNEPKSRVQSYLATRSPIVNSLGLGAKNKYWNFDHLCFNDIKRFISELFGRGSV